MFNNILSHRKINSAVQSDSFNQLKHYLQHLPKSLIGLGAIGLLLVVGIPIAQTRLAAQETAEVNNTAVLSVETLTVEPVSGYEVARTYTGEIAALRTSDLGFERTGQLVEVYVQEGDRVAAGIPIARLDIRNL